MLTKIHEISLSNTHKNFYRSHGSKQIHCQYMLPSCPILLHTCFGARPRSPANAVPTLTIYTDPNGRINTEANQSARVHSFTVLTYKTVCEYVLYFYKKIKHYQQYTQFCYQSIKLTYLQVIIKTLKIVIKLMSLMCNITH